MKVTKAEIRPIVMATFPSYKGRTFEVTPTTHVTLSNLNWCGGTKSTYKALSFDGETVTLMPVAPWEEYREGLKLQLPTNVVLVRHCYFCGADLGITVYAHPSLLPKWLPALAGKE